MWGRGDTTIAFERQESAFVGLKFAALTDFLRDPGIVGEQPSARLAATLARWEEAVGALHGWAGRAIALRYRFDPARRGTTIALLGRVAAASAGLPAAQAALADDLRRFAAAARLAVPMPLSGPALQDWREPWAGRPVHLIEVRQREELWRGGNTLGIAFAFVRPLGYRPQGDWRQLFATLLAQQAPVQINLHLEPTQLAPEERAALDRKVSAALKVTQQGHPVGGGDLRAQQLAQLYQHYQHELAQPFLLALQVVSPSGDTARNVANALRESVLAQAGGAEPCPPDCALSTPPHAAAWHAAYRTLTMLECTPWDDTPPTAASHLRLNGAAEARFPHLVGARRAAVAFRCPIPLGDGVPGIAVRPLPPSREQGAGTGSLRAGDLPLGLLPDGHPIGLPRDTIARHILIAGANGTGKTNTCLALLGALWADPATTGRPRIPFLVIDPFGREFRRMRALPGFEDVLIFTVGREGGVPLRLNPLLPAPGVTIEEHLRVVLVAFGAAWGLTDGMKRLMVRAMRQHFAECGHALTDTWDAHAPGRRPPTMRGLRNTLVRAAAALRLEAKERDAALTYIDLRFAAFLLPGGQGAIFDCDRGIPLATLLSRPVILELDSLADPQERAAAAIFLLTAVRNAFQAAPRPEGSHVLLIDEAHRLMRLAPRVAPDAARADTENDAANYLGEMLQEVRKLGLAIIISDQSPSDLHPSVLREPATKIIHRLEGAGERARLADGMQLLPEQREYVGELRQREALVRHPDLSGAVVVQFPDVRRDSPLGRPLDDEAVRAAMAPFRAGQAGAALPYDGCALCTSQCRHRDAVAEFSADDDAAAINARFRENRRRAADPLTPPATQALLTDEALRLASQVPGHDRHPSLDAAWCYLCREGGVRTSEVRRWLEQLWLETRRGTAMTMKGTPA